jgi:hypothetical protein
MEKAVMTRSALHRIAIIAVAVALGSAVIETDAVAAGGNAYSPWGGGMGGGGHFGGGFGGGFGAGKFEHGHYGPRGYYPFGYYDGYGDYGSSSNNGCISLDAHGCEE